MGLHLISPGDKLPDEANVVIEIPAHSEPIKYEIDKDTGALFVDRFISTYMRYPCNYGYIPQTLSEDGDPVDVLVITPLPVNHGCVIPSRPIGVLRMADEKGIDLKIIAVPTDELSPLYHDVRCIADVQKPLMQQIEHFFTHYKDLEGGKWVKLEGWDTADAAKEEMLACLARYKEAE